jgi:beta-glucanase (GH16 family)
VFSVSLLLGAITCPLPGYHLAWSDEFDQRGLPNKWRHTEGQSQNSEAQYFTCSRLENAFVREGVLTIQARHDGWQQHEYTSASLSTESKYEFKYGYVEVRAKCPTGRGVVPSITLLNSDFRKIGWPKCGQIDLMGYVGYDPDRVHFNLHTEGYNHMIGTNRGSNIEIPKFATQFHTYGLEWTKDYLRWFLDGTEMMVFKKAEEDIQKWPFDDPQFLTLALSVGGVWGGQKGIDPTAFPSKFEVDYVRIFKK